MRTYQPKWLMRCYPKLRVIVIVVTSVKMFGKLSLLDRYIIKHLIPTFLFSLAICTTLAELIGISFEQVKFITSDRVSIATSLYVHLLKLPAFLSLGLPLALLLGTLLTYSNLSARNEIIALRTFGVSLFRIITPVLLTGFVITGIIFIFHELVVPPANYQAAILLENEWNVDRTQLAKYNKREIVYQQYTTTQDKPSLESLFFAERFDGQKMQEITFLQYHNQELKQIIVSQAAQWNEKKQLWQILSGHQYILKSDGSYAQINQFQELPLKLTKNILDYADHHRDHREMNVLELYQRLKIIQHTGNLKEIRQLKISIQERYAFPFSCLVFAFLGSALGLTTGTVSKSNSFGVTIIVIFAYYAIQFIASYLSVAGIIPVFLGIWFPNLLGLFFGSHVIYNR